MKKQSAEILLGLYKKMKEQKIEAEQLCNFNTKRIIEIETYLKLIHEKEDENYNVFSPRKVETEFKYQMEESGKEKTECLCKKRYYENRITEIREYIYELDKLIKLEDLKG